MVIAFVPITPNVYDGVSVVRCAESSVPFSLYLFCLTGLDSDIVKLNEVGGAASQSESTLPIVSPAALQISSWSFTLADSVMIAYASTDDRDVALQQITQVWEDALGTDKSA